MKVADDLNEGTETLLPRLIHELRSNKTKLTSACTLRVDPEAGTARLIDGNTRLVAVEEAGYSYIPVLVQYGVSLHGWGRPLPTNWKEPSLESGWVLASDLGFKALPCR